MGSLGRRWRGKRVTSSVSYNKESERVESSTHSTHVAGSTFFSDDILWPSPIPAAAAVVRTWAWIQRQRFVLKGASWEAAQSRCAFLMVHEVHAGIRADCVIPAVWAPHCNDSKRNRSSPTMAYLLVIVYAPHDLTSWSWLLDSYYQYI